jgi:hypothetical protein
MPSNPHLLPERLDFADFAQEFLRRNGRYQNEFRQLVECQRLGVGFPDCLAMARSWGLLFPGPAPA